MRAIIGLGANKGRREKRIIEAAEALERIAHLTPLALSSAYQTAPIGPPQPPYLNAAALVEAELTPKELMAALLGLEAALGRERGTRWGPRVIDLDLLIAEDHVVDTPLLTLPHPRLTERAFALVPLLELAPEARDPRTGEPLREALDRLDQAVGPGRPIPAEVPRRDLDHTADLGFSVSGPTLARALEQAAMALIDVMVDRQQVTERERHVIEAEGDDPAELLVSALSEVVFLFDARQLVPRRVTLIKLEGAARAQLALFGEPLQDEAQVKAQVKAVTYHGAELSRDPGSGRWTATAIVDV